MMMNGRFRSEAFREMLPIKLIFSQRLVVDILMRRRDETLEQRMRLVRLALEFRMKLAGNVKRVLRQFDHFHELAIRR